MGGIKGGQGPQDGSRCSNLFILLSRETKPQVDPVLDHITRSAYGDTASRGGSYGPWCWASGEECEPRVLQGDLRAQYSGSGFDDISLRTSVLRGGAMEPQDRTVVGPCPRSTERVGHEDLQNMPDRADSTLPSPFSTHAPSCSAECIHACTHVCMLVSVSLCCMREACQTVLLRISDA